MQPKYRTDYDGEFVITKSRWYESEKTQSREWVENPVDNQHISNRAAVIGSTLDESQFDFRRLVRHKGGLLGNQRLQTYGSGELWKEMQFNFLVATQVNDLNKISESGYYNDTVVFTDTKNCLQNPGKFYLTPYQPKLDQLALAVYIAAFDAHEEIFLLGYNNETPHGLYSWKEHINEVFEAYQDTKFILVGVDSNMPDLWKNNTNVSCMDYRSFIYYCDI